MHTDLVPKRSQAGAEEIDVRIWNPELGRQ